MKRWAVLTVLLYALALLVLTVPVAQAAFGNWGKNAGGASLHDILEAFKFWGYWVWLVVLVAGQSLLLLLPISISERRLPARRPLKIPVIVTAFFLANLLLAGLLSLLCAIFRDEARYIAEWVSFHRLQGVERFYLWFADFAAPATLDAFGAGVISSGS